VQLIDGEGVAVAGAARTLAFRQVLLERRSRWVAVVGKVFSRISTILTMRLLTHITQVRGAWESGGP